MPKPEPTTRQDDLFYRYPLTSLKQTSNGMLPIPYHIYDGHALFMGGTAQLSAVQELLKTEDIHAVETVDGKALMGIWVVDGTSASLGAHKELQFSIVVSRRPIKDVRPHPFAILNLMLFNPDVRLLCHGLWNDTQTVVTYNREILALNAHLAQGSITRDTASQSMQFSFTDPTSKTIFSGKVREELRPPSNTLMPMIGLMGLRRFIQAANTRCLNSQVVNPVGLLPFNAEAQAYVVNDKQILQLFNPQTDTLEFSEPTYQALQFQGHFVEHMIGFKFVYLNIHNGGDARYIQG